MDVSVVVPALAAPGLGATLEALLAQTCPAREIVVVGMVDPGVAEAFPAVRFIDTGQPAYPGAARNIGIRETSSEVVAFTDADCVPAPDWIARHLVRHQLGERVVGGSVELGRGGYLARGDDVSMLHAYLRGERRGERDVLPTLNLSVRRDVIEVVGVMDERFRSGEDADWTSRMRVAGYRLYFDPAARVRHEHRRASWADVREHWRMFGRNGVRVRQAYDGRGARRLLVPPLLRFGGPLLALAKTVDVYRRPATWPFLTSLPLVYWTKLQYCLGAAESLARQEGETADTAAGVGRRRRVVPPGAADGRDRASPGA